MELGSQRSSLRIVHRGHCNGRWPYRILHSHQLQKGAREAWQTHSRRTSTTDDHWCHRSSHWPVLVRLVSLEALSCPSHMLTSLRRTSDPHIAWVPQVLSSALLGMGCLVTFWQGMNYIIDCYGFYSNSAIAINTFLRSIAGAGFPLFAPAMYHNLVRNTTHIRAFCYKWVLTIR
jgi:ABC-type uncharacterized transport system permease subunit